MILGKVDAFGKGEGVGGQVMFAERATRGRDERVRKKNLESIMAMLEEAYGFVRVEEEMFWGDEI